MPRKKITIDWKKVGKMLEAGCTGSEVAAILGMHDNTLYRRCEEDNKVSFSDYITTKRASGDSLLKIKQFEIAMSGEKSMLIWLGKQRLGQVDRREHDINAKIAQVETLEWRLEERSTDEEEWQQPSKQKGASE